MGGMCMVKTKGIILKTADLGEADQFLAIYSKDFGKIKVIARGAKKLQSKLRYHLEPISLSQFILVEGKNYKIVKDAILINQFLNIKKNLSKAKASHKISNLMDDLIVGEEKDEEIWNLILKTFKFINKNTIKKNNLVKEFKNSLLKVLGYSPEHVGSAQDIY